MGAQYLPAIILAIFMASVGLFGEMSLTKLQVIGARATPLHANSAAADAWAENAMTTFVAGNPTTAISSALFGSGTTINGIAVSAAVDGDSTSGGSTSEAANLNSTIGERRVAIDITLQTTTAPVVSLTFRRLYRVINVAPFIVALGTAIPGAIGDASQPGGSDTGGCAGSGKGCDALATQAADSQLAASAKSCVNGYGPARVLLANNSVTQLSQTSGGTMRRIPVNNGMRTLRGQTIPEVLIVLAVIAALCGIAKLSTYFFNNPGQLAYKELSAAVNTTRGFAENGATSLTISGKQMTFYDVNGAVTSSQQLDNAPTFTWTGNATPVSTVTFSLTANGTATPTSGASCTGLTATVGNATWPMTCTPLSM